MKGTVRCPACGVSATADAMWAFPHRRGCVADKPGSILEYDDNVVFTPEPWPTWDWPKRTNSYRLEMVGYEYQQKQVRFTDFPITPITPIQRHRLGRLAHLIGRTA